MRLYQSDSCIVDFEFNVVKLKRKGPTDKSLAVTVVVKGLSGSSSSNCADGWLRPWTSAPDGAGDRYYRFTETLAISQRFKQNPNEPTTTWVLQGCDQRGQSLSLNSRELALLDDLTSDAIFNS
ncbi:hypothetical protein CB1_000902009 [Camelus ferus]|nr:hypothetical protein CB1_000902009 [Camelus ferus]